MSDPANNNTHAYYDVHDNVTGVRDAVDNLHTYEYDFNGHLLRILRDGGSKVREYIRDPAGNVTRMNDYDGSITHYSYDALNRMTGISYPDDTTASFTYDALSRLLTATNETGTVTYTYDNRGRVSSVTDVWGYRVDYGYDNTGNRISLNVSEGQTGLYDMTYVYDAMNRVTSQTDAVNSVSYEYDATGNLTSRILNNAFTATYGYDRLNRLTGINYAHSGNNLSGFAYEYDNAMKEAVSENWTGR